VASGHSVVVAFAMDHSVGTVRAADSAGNTYTVDADVTTATGVRTVLLAAHNVLPLPGGSTITITHPSAAARALSATEFSAVAATSALDRTSTSTGKSTSPSSGTTAMTNQTSEILIGVIGVEGPVTETFTPGASFTSLAGSGTTGGSPASNITVRAEYRIVALTGAYSATGTLNASRGWAAAIGTYRLELLP
jgi:hypothetical protein